MLSKRLTAPREAVSLTDPALLQIETRKVREYAMTRDISVLGDLKTLADKLTIFVLKPMLPKYEHLETNLAALFAHHVSEVRNGPLEPSDWEPIPGDVTGMQRLSEEGLNALPRETVIEMGRLVWELASKDGETSPFTFRAIELVEQRTAQQQLSVIRASLAETAKPIPSE
jgi:hypothetical protein